MEGLENIASYRPGNDYISPTNSLLKMIFLFPRWDMLVPWRVELKKADW